MTSRRYRYTPKSLDLAFVFGALGASALPGSVLLRMMSAIGTHESAAPNLLTTRSMQTIEVDRVGRHAVYRLGPGALASYRENRGHLGPAALALTIEHRTFRDRFRYLTAFAGYGTLRSELLISPEDRRARVEVQVGDCPTAVGSISPSSSPTISPSWRCWTGSTSRSAHSCNPPCGPRWQPSIPLAWPSVTALRGIPASVTASRGRTGPDRTRASSPAS